MDPTQPAALTRGPVQPSEEAPLSSRAGAPSGPARAAPLGHAGKASGAELRGLDWLSPEAGRAASPGWTVAPRAGRPGPASGPTGTGYAPAPPPARGAPAKPSPPKSPSTAPSVAKPSGDWAFLSDPNTSVEDKLFRFMQLVQKKTDDDLVKKMEDYRAKHVVGTSKSAEGAQKPGSSLLGLVKTIFPPAGLVDRLLGGDGGLLVQAVEKLGGPLLASLATAFGLPGLAPLALQVGGQLAGSVAKAVGSGADATSGKAEKKESGTPDERLSMLEIQRLVEKQNQMFALVSNILKGMHETGMGVVNNIR